MKTKSEELRLFTQQLISSNIEIPDCIKFVAQLTHEEYSEIYKECSSIEYGLDKIDHENHKINIEIRVKNLKCRDEKHSEEELRIMRFGNYIFNNKDNWKFYIPSGLDKSYMRMPMEDILKMFQKEELDKVKSKKK